MLKVSSHFILPFNTVHKSVVFPIPKSNQYQNISGIKSSLKSKRFFSNWNNEVCLFPQGEPSFLSFSHHAKRVYFDFNTIEVYKKKDLPLDDTFISGSNRKILDLNNKLLSDRKKKNNKNIVKSLYYGLIDFLEYGNPIDGLHTYKQALENKKTDCGGFSTLLASLLKANGIHSRLVIGYIFSKSK